MATCGKAARARAKIRSRAREEASSQEVRRYYKQFARAKRLEWKSWIDNEVFDFVDLRKFKTDEFRNRLMGTNHEKRQARQIPQGKSEDGY